MTNEFSYLMHVAGCIVTGRDLEPIASSTLDWTRLFQLAKEQAVPFLLAYAVRRKKDLGCPQALSREWSAQMFATLLPVGCDLAIIPHMEPS